MNYYNEWDKGAAAWLRELIKAGHLPQGYVDERSITEVTPSDLEGFTQCHFFAGIGGWSYALQLAGVPATTRLWTGSPPCQPFSVAGKQLGQLDERHLAPTFMRLVGKCRPPVLFGEQVAAAIGKHWLDDLFVELERQGYACGSAVLPAASVGAPHKRDRLFFGAVGNASYIGQHRGGDAGASGRNEYPDYGSAGGMADTDDTRPQRRQRVSQRTDQQPSRAAGMANRMEHPGGQRRKRREAPAPGYQHDWTAPVRAESEYGVGEPGTHRVSENTADPHHGYWSDADWLGCRDGKFRPVIASFISLVDGFSDSLGCGGYPRIRESSEVFKLPEGVSAEAFFFRRTGKPVNVEASEVLRSKVHGEGAGRDKGADASKLSQAVGEGFDRNLYELPEENREDACTPQGREPFKQRAVKLDDIVCELSQQSALAELQQRNYDAQALRALRDACAEKWSVQHSFVAVESVWSSFSEEDKARERMDFNAGIWRRVEFFPLSSGEEGRVGRLRGYGNAIVPQVAAEFIKAFTGAVADAGN